MKFIFFKIEEWIENIWVKLLLIIPACFFEIQEKEKIMLVALMFIVTIDCILGSMAAAYVDEDFEWNLLAKKFCKKFLLYFFTLTASFIISKAYEFISWWFYVIGSIITFSEFGQLLVKSKKLGLPIRSEYISYLNDRMDCFIKGMLNIEKQKCKKRESSLKG